MPPTMAEREAELAALQSAFDEYIASSRELEEELDAELAKMRKFTTVCIRGSFGTCVPSSVDTEERIVPMFVSGDNIFFLYCLD